MPHRLDSFLFSFYFAKSLCSNFLFMKKICIAFLLFSIFTTFFSKTFAQDTLNRKKVDTASVKMIIFHTHHFLRNRRLDDVYSLKGFNQFGVGFLFGKNRGKFGFQLGTAILTLDSLGIGKLKKHSRVCLSFNYVRHTYLHKNIGLRARVGMQLFFDAPDSREYIHNSIGTVTALGLVFRGEKYNSFFFIDVGYNSQKNNFERQKPIFRDFSAWLLTSGFIF